ncbi:hypothetical protein E4U58_002704 [Claviceps cyperi]|nr:hypothetical protein E4U58_002704 [Claviceps cyperi]
MVICGGDPFDLWEQEDMVNFINALSPDWKPPSRQNICKQLLRECFESVEAQVLERIKHTEYLNFALEDMFDLSRAINMSLITEGGALLLCTLSVPTYGRVTAGWIKEWDLFTMGETFSRALQLFVNGTISLEPFKSLFLEAETIVNKFTEFPKQYSLSVSKMDVRRPLTAALMARWGTELRMLDSFLANEDALIEYSSDSHADLSVELK